jgi:hypothetical protein
MNNFSEICKLTGFVFNKGFVLGEVATTGQNVSSKNYRVRMTISGFETEGLLNGAHSPSNIQPNQE